MNQEHFQVRDRVEFTGKRGKIVGTIIDLKVSKKKGPRRFSHIMSLMPEISTEKAKVAPDPDYGTGIWTVPVRMLTKLGKATQEDVIKGKQNLSLINATKRNNAIRRSDNRFEKIADWVYNLKRGDMIWVDFKDFYGNTKKLCKFVEVSKAGKIAFLYPITGSKRSSNPQFVHHYEPGVSP